MHEFLSHSKNYITKGRSLVLLGLTVALVFYIRLILKTVCRDADVNGGFVKCFQIGFGFFSRFKIGNAPPCGKQRFGQAATAALNRRP